MFFNIFFLLVGMFLAIVVHEAGHWFAGVVLGIPIYAVSVGIGPVVARFRFGTTAIELRRLGLAGEVRYARMLPIGRCATLFVLLGGVLGNAALIGVVALVSSGPGAPIVALAAPGVTLAQAFLIVANLVPWRGRYGRSDGYQIVDTLVRGTRSTAVALQAGYVAMLQPYGAADAPSTPSKTSCHIAFQLARLDIADERRDAADALSRELAGSAARTDERLLITESLITRHLLGVDLGIAGRIDELSSRALTIAPGLATLRATRGAVLLDLGRYAEGKALLAPILEGPPSWDTALSGLFLARAERARGDFAEASRRAEGADAAFRAHPYSSAFPLVALVRRRIEAETRAS